MSVNYYIVLVDDDVDDIQLMQEALAESHCCASLLPVIGVDTFLQTLLPAANSLSMGLAVRAAFIPDLFLLDLNIPKVNGLQLLQFIRAHPDLRRSKVVMFTTSTNPLDRQSCLQAGADLFLVKPSSFNELMTLCGFLQTEFLPTGLTVQQEGV